MNPLGALLWIGEHWWIFAALAIVALAALLLSGVASLGVVVKVLAEVAAAIAEFFVTPREQIAAKVVYGIAVATIALSAGWYHRGHVDALALAQAEAAHKAAMEKLNADSERESKAKIAKATADETARADAAEKRIKDYDAKLATLPVGDCRITDDDLAAAGVRRPSADRLDVRHHPGFLQRGLKRSPAR